MSENSKLISLCPELKKGILVLGGRTNFSKHFSEDVHQPAILSPKHELTKLLIHYYHEKFQHRGMELIINELRQKYYVIHARAADKTAFAKCIKCRIEKSKPIPMVQIPEERLKREIRPFVNIRVDYFGPIFVKIGTRIENRWGGAWEKLIRTVKKTIGNNRHIRQETLQTVLLKLKKSSIQDLWQKYRLD